jgi:diguanylate cyclase (GGDEF)-like protein
MPETILVADDDPAIVHLVEVNLKLEGFEVLTANDGEEALRMVQDNLPALVLLDVMTPKLDGYEVCERIRSESGTRHINVIMLTAKSLTTDKIFGLTAGADDYVLKPFDPMELVARVRATLRRSKEMRSSSPLTGLPGNIQIEDEIRRRHLAAEPIAVCYADLDNFKAYNDRYGFLQGDRAITCTAQILRVAVADDQHAFVGHIGGDDFALIVTIDRAESTAQKAIELFDSEVGALYEPADLERGYIEVQDRRGRMMRYPILSLSIGIGLSGDDVSDYREIVDSATEMKTFAKRQPGSSYAIDRRGHDQHETSGPAPA